MNGTASIGTTEDHHIPQQQTQTESNPERPRSSTSPASTRHGNFFYFIFMHAKILKIIKRGDLEKCLFTLNIYLFNTRSIE